LSGYLLFADAVGAFATLALAYLTYLLLFETGTSYRVAETVHELDDDARARLLSTVLATPVQTIHSFRVLNEGGDLYDEQVQVIRNATRSVHLEVYIFRRGRAAAAIYDALCERAAAGVRVRVIIDAIGSVGTSAAYFARLIASGGSVNRYHPLRPALFRRWNNRTHRNLLLVDGAVGFIGGAGIADHWRRVEPAPWRDCVLCVTGPIVAGLQTVFGENWLECSGELLVEEDSYPPSTAAGPAAGAVACGLVIGSTPTAGRSTRARILVQLLLASARTSIDLCSPYFVPDRGIRRELIAARERGVRVRVITGGPYGDHGIVRRAGRRRYGTLLEAGVEIGEYATRMMHAKVLIIDSHWSLLGSANIDHRSFGLNDEVNIAVASNELAAQLEHAFERDLQHCDSLDIAIWRRRSWGERILATLGRVIERHQ
jgi:cardiolipin synthase